MSQTFAEHGGAQPTQYEKLRAIPWALGYDLANTFFVQLTFFGSVFILFLDDLGLSEAQIGLLLSILPFLSLLSLFITPPVARLGYKRTFLIFIAIRNLFTAGLLLVPWLSGRLETSVLVRYVAFITIAFAVGRAVAMTAFLPWQQEYIPHQMRGRYSGYSSIMISLSGLVAVGLASFVLDRPLGDWRYPLLFGIGVFFGIVSIFLASRLPGGAPVRSGISLFRFDKKVLKPLRDSRFIRYLVAMGLTTLAMGPILSFLPIFMKERVGLNPGSIVLLQTGGLVGSLLSSYFWGWLADRYGSKPIALNGLLMTVLLPIFWFMMPRASLWSLPAALAISLLQGIASTGWSIGSGRLLFDSIATGEGRTEYLSQYNAWAGILSGAGSILGGTLLQYFSTTQLNIFNMSVDSYSILFGIGFLLSLLSLLIMYSLHVPRETGLGELAGLFFHGNPLMAISSMIHFYFAREETDVLYVTERLGRARSPLSVEELIGSLEDPRFYVRFEAIVAITRHRANDRLIQALVEVMEAPDPAMSVIAAWALGRMGSTEAIPALRNAFHSSKYHSVKAHAVRALGTLRDRESIPSLLDHVRNNPDLGIKAACASSLGKLRVMEATPDILHILYIDNYPQSRREMGLSLARLLEAEANYIALSRSTDEDPGTALAQEIELLRSLSERSTLEDQGLSSHLAGARDRFARGNLKEGLEPLLTAFQLFSTSTVSPDSRLILTECESRIREFSTGRMEYIILALVAMEISMR
jgi:MFS family permease